LGDIGKITFRKMLNMLLFVFRLFAVLAGYRPSIVYLTIMPTGKIFYRDAVFIFISKIFCKKVIIHLHGKGVNEEIGSSSFKKWLYRNTFRHTDLICLSPLLVNDISLTRAKKIHVLPNGIPAQPFGPKTSGRIPVIIFLSNLVQNKGIAVFLQSLATLHQSGFDFHAKVIGKPYDFSLEDAQQFCNENMLQDKVSILGPKFGAEKYAELNTGDIFVLPSFNECFPLSILEAMQTGLAVVASSIGGIPDMLVDGETGLLVKPRDKDDLAEKIILLLSDPAMMTRMGQRARESFYRSYTIEKFNHGLAGIFRSVLQKK
ncbi:MAG: glycosyltransferase family 1 protein, partial [Chitinophagaceae bacterium]